MEDNMVPLQCGQVISSVPVSVSNVWLQMTHVCCFFMWTPVHFLSITVSLISSDVKLTFVMPSSFSKMVASLVLKYFTSSKKSYCVKTPEKIPYNMLII